MKKALLMPLIILLFSVFASPCIQASAVAENPIPVPIGFVVDEVDTPGQIFVAAGPPASGFTYRLYYSITEDAPQDPIDATEYSWGSNPGDGGSSGPFGFALTGLETGIQYTIWLYHYDATTDSFSEPAVETAVSGGNGGGADQPESPAPLPTDDPENVISFFSAAYDDVPVDTWRTPWSAADYQEVDIDGRTVKLYTNLNFVGIETIANQLDVNEMGFFNVDVWTPNMDVFRVKLVDFGPDGQFGGGDDTEHEVVFTGLPKGGMGIFTNPDVWFREPPKQRKYCAANFFRHSGRGRYCLRRQYLLQHNRRPYGAASRKT